MYGPLTRGQTFIMDMMESIIHGILENLFDFLEERFGLFSRLLKFILTLIGVIFVAATIILLFMYLVCMVVAPGINLFAEDENRCECILWGAGEFNGSMTSDY
ncbi:hypothetical protein FGO68_gene3483 [Halteria grandinella]|uniref:Uncharacterized protein n=1 Tax=Halteria grandinella TaxID=5974 RepID=A0A8J8N968_HALGN|nr:hypothetical protein FGO68_gene3483 [Halteria grandinella]